MPKTIIWPFVKPSQKFWSTNFFQEQQSNPTYRSRPPYWLSQKIIIPGWKKKTLTKYDHEKTLTKYDHDPIYDLK